VERFETTTRGLLALHQWLESHECTHLVMEATGVYWKPVWHMLEGSFELVLANAAQVRNVPGRKSDRRGHVALPHRRPLGFLGGPLSSNG